MTTAPFARIEALFHEALAQPPASRAAFLRGVEPDPEIVAAVERLLALDDDTAPDPVAERLQRVARDSAPAMRGIGPYRLLRELGAGGMGTVFLAERDVEGVAQQVALKLLHGYPTEAGKRRMARERALLAGLNHPHIAGHIDGGESADGQPYLVMDYVESMPLPEYLATARPTLRARLTLYLALCDAVQHAHQRLILHRDIKPSNVVVRKDGAPVLLDFGVGTLIEAEDQPDHTVTRAYTPGYGAPEQRRGQGATTATDVFGLGTLLFDLLTDERLSALCPGDDAVPTPSAVARDPVRRRMLRGDLDRIVGKATAEDPEHRYRTVAALADDVQRYLQGLPIAAAPDRTLYRLRKFVNRHRVAVAAASAIVIAAVLFVWRLDLERQRALAAETVARREAVSAKASRDFLASVLAQTSPETVRGKPLSVSTLLGNAAAKLQRDRSQDVGTRAIAWLTIAEVYSDTKDPKPGLAAADTARALLATRPDGDLDLTARELRVRGSLLTQLERMPEARESGRQLIALRLRQGAGPLTLARAYNDYGTMALHAGDFRTAEHYHLRALALSDQAGARDPALRADILLSLVSSRYYLNDIAAAARYLDRATDAARALPPGDGIVEYKRQRLSMMVRHAQHRYDDALTHAEKALALSYRVYGRDSRLTGDMELYLALLLDDVGRTRAAIPHYARSQAIARALRLDDATLARDDVRVAMAEANLGQFADAVAMVDSALPRMPATPLYMPWLIKAHYTRGLALSASGRYPQARPDFERALQLARGYRGEVFVGPAFVQLRHAQALVEAGRFAEARAALQAAAPIAQYRDLDPKALLVLRNVEALLAMQRGHAAEATRSIDAALVLARRHYLAGTLPIANVEFDAAKIALQAGDTDGARRLLASAMPVLRRDLHPAAPQLAESRRLLQRLDAEPAPATRIAPPAKRALR